MANEIMHAEQASAFSSSIALFVAGTAVGAIAALLLAPQAGRETRKQLNGYGQRISDTMSEWATAAHDLFTAHDKPNRHSRMEEIAKPLEHHNRGAKPQTHALAL